MNSPLELCCQACGQYYTIHSVPPERESCRQLRRSPRTSCKPIIPAVAVQSTNSVLCSDCLDTIKLLATSADINDDENDTTPGSSATNENDTSIAQHHDSVPDASAYDQNDTDYSKQFIEMSNCSHDKLEFSTSSQGSLASRIVSPESCKSPHLNSSKMCRACKKREVPEEFMEYCKRCYAMNCKGINPFNDGCDKKETASNKTTGRCRLCKGFVKDSSHQYCFKCYSAKQRDDANRIQKELYQKQIRKDPEPPPVDRIPYVCVDCGNKIHDCSWKTKCPPCYALIRAAAQGKPKLIKAPVKGRFQGRNKYTRR